MKKTIILSVLALTLVSCSKEKKESFTLKGTIQNRDANTEPYNGYVYIQYGKVKDSVKAVDNQFQLEGIVEKPTQAYLNVEPPAFYKYVYLENSDIDLYATWWIEKRGNDDYNRLQLDSIVGSTSQDIQDRFRNFSMGIRLEKNQTEKLYQELKAIATEYPAEPAVGGLFATQSATTYNQLNYDQVIDILSVIDTSAMNKGDMEMISLAAKTLKISQNGNPFPAFDMPSNQGKQVTGDQFKGKVTLVDFWASWCGPCRMKHPKLINFYKKNQDKDFNVVSISSDEKKEDWIKAIAQDDLNYWPNAWDEGSKFNKELGIMAIPYSYLLDEEGKIIGKNLSFEQIQTILDE